MSIARVNTDYLTGAADAIRRKTGSQEAIPLPQFESEIDALPTAPTLIPKTITQNGVYNASSDNADGYDVVTVDVPEKNTLDELFADTLEVANIPSASSIGNIFRGKLNLVNVIMPNVTNIGNSAFQGCTSLALTSLPNGLTEIGANAFDFCTSLALTSLPNGITGIGASAFKYCNKIIYLDFSDFTNIPTLGPNAFSNTTFPFYFRDQQQLDEWAAATNWSTYAGRFQIKPSGVI